MKSFFHKINCLKYVTSTHEACSEFTYLENARFVSETLLRDFSRVTGSIEHPNDTSIGEYSNEKWFMLHIFNSLKKCELIDYSAIKTYFDVFSLYLKILDEIKTRNKGYHLKKQSLSLSDDMFLNLLEVVRQQRKNNMWLSPLVSQPISSTTQIKRHNIRLQSTFPASISTIYHMIRIDTYVEPYLPTPDHKCVMDLDVFEFKVTKRMLEEIMK